MPDVCRGPADAHEALRFSSTGYMYAYIYINIMEIDRSIDRIYRIRLAESGKQMITTQGPVRWELGALKCLRQVLNPKPST